MESTSRPPAPGSPLGFGCAGLLRLPSGADQIALLECAYDSGIRHFDVARMYGLGKAEEVLGRFAAPRRNEITIATKFGIQVTENLARASNVQAAGRWVLQRFPALRKRLKGRLGGSTSRDFSVAAATASVSESLRMLGMDSVDYLMLHEPQSVDEISPELIDYLEGLKQEGKVRAFGTAAEFSVAEAVALQYPPLAETLQVPSPSLAERKSALLGSSARRLITFGHLQADRDRVAAGLKAHGGIVKSLGLEPSDGDAAGLLLLRQSVLLNPEGSTLFFTSSRPRLEKTVRYVLRPTEPGEMDALATVLGR